MTLDDLYRGFLDCLSALGAPAGLSPSQAALVFEGRESDKGLATLVAVDLDAPKNGVVGTVSLLLERKYIHAGGWVVHLEDLAVLPAYQKKGVGARLAQAVCDLARSLGAYKVILDCDDEAVGGFYAKLGFVKRGTQMRLDIAPSSCHVLN